MGSPSWTSAPPPEAVPTEPAPEFPPEWTVVEGVHAVVGGDPADHGVVLRVARHADAAIPRIAEILGLPPGHRVRIYVTPTNAAFQGLQPGSPEAWADATAWPAQAMVFLRTPRIRSGTDEPLEQVLDHELVHVILGQGPTPVPRWFQEGVAQVVAGQYGPEVTRTIARGILGEDLLDLRELSHGFPVDPVRARLAYAQAADFVAWMRQEYGEEALRRLVLELAAGTPVGAAVRSATGEALEDVDLAWRARLESSHLWLAALVNEGLWWGVGAGLLVLAAWRMRRRNARRRRILEERDALESALRGWTLAGGQPGGSPEDPPGPHLRLVVDNSLPEERPPGEAR